MHIHIILLGNRILCFKDSVSETDSSIRPSNSKKMLAKQCGKEAANTERFSRSGGDGQACSDLISLLMKRDVCALHTNGGREILSFPERQEMTS